jgi:hypothetical protein
VDNRTATGEGVRTTAPSGAAAPPGATALPGVGAGSNDTKDEENTNDVGAATEEATRVPTPTATDKGAVSGTQQESGQVTSTNARICSNIERMCVCVWMRVRVCMFVMYCVLCVVCCVLCVVCCVLCVVCCACVLVLYVCIYLVESEVHSSR